MYRVQLLGRRLLARGFDRQVAGVQVCIAVLNGDTALGIPVTDNREINPSGERRRPFSNGFVQHRRT